MKRSLSARSSATVLLAVFAAVPALAQGGAEPSSTAAQPTEEASEPNTGENASRVDGEPAKDLSKAIGDVERSLGMDLRTDRHYAGGYLAMGEEFYAKKITKEELKKRLALVEANRDERRKDHLQGLKNRWGALLAHPGCREELRFHARREARLTRALFLAHTEAPAELAAKLVPRLEALIEREEERHTRAMERLRETPATPPPAASAAGNAPPAAAKEATR